MTCRGLYTPKKIEAMAFTEDAAEGQRAFREKRAPQWRGR